MVLNFINSYLNKNSHHDYHFRTPLHMWSVFINIFCYCTSSWIVKHALNIINNKACFFTITYFPFSQNVLKWFLSEWIWVKYKWIVPFGKNMWHLMIEGNMVAMLKSRSQRGGGRLWQSNGWLMLCHVAQSVPTFSVLHVIGSHAS